MDQSEADCFHKMKFFMHSTVLEQSEYNIHIVHQVGIIIVFEVVFELQNASKIPVTFSKFCQ